MWLLGNGWAAGQVPPRRPAGDYFLPFFFAAFFAGAFFFAAAMVHLSSVLRSLMRPLRNVGASDQPVEGDLSERGDTRCAARVSIPSVARPTRFQLVLNRRAAQALNVKVPARSGRTRSCLEGVV